MSHPKKEDLYRFEVRDPNYLLKSISPVVINENCWIFDCETRISDLEIKAECTKSGWIIKVGSCTIRIRSKNFKIRRVITTEAIFCDFNIVVYNISSKSLDSYNSYRW